MVGIVTLPGLAVKEIGAQTEGAVMTGNYCCPRPITTAGSEYTQTASG
jgi:hypothetical protein